MHRESLFDIFQRAISSRLGIGVKSFFFSLMLVLGYSVHCYAGTYYVSPTGGASWSSCTISSTPCAATTAMTNAVAGDTVYFLAGTYTPPYSGAWNVPDYNPSNSGSSGSPIIFQANPGDTVTIVPSASRKTNNGYLIGSSSKNHIVWDGVIIDDAGMTALGGGAYIGGSYCTIRNCTFKGVTKSSADNNPLIRLQSAHYTLIQNNIIRDQAGGDEDCGGIQNYYSTNTTIEHNEIYNCATAINEKDSSTGEIIRYNLIHNVSVGIAGPGNESINSIDVYQNIFYNVSNKVFDIRKEWANGAVHNNTFYNIATGLNFWSTVTATTAVSVYNNIFHTTTASGISKQPNGLVFCNYNNYYNSSTFTINYGSVSLARWKSSTGFDANSITSDPLFVNVGNHDFHLQNGSSASSNGRSGGVMGAYITGSEIIGVTTTPLPGSLATPNPPLGLR